jgi:hypothetical protein
LFLTTTKDEEEIWRNKVLGTAAVHPSHYSRMCPSSQESCNKYVEHPKNRARLERLSSSMTMFKVMTWDALPGVPK